MMRRFGFTMAVACAIGVGLFAQRGNAPAPAPAPATPAQGQAAAPARGRGPSEAETGAVRGPSGAVIGYTKMAPIPGTPWLIHDVSRPHPHVVTPGATAGAPPSDAVVLFDGKDFSKFAHVQNGQFTPAPWAVRDGYFEVVPRSGSIVTRDKFGDMQLHVEWATPNPAVADSQSRGNSGVILMGLYEIEVLDSWNNLTYSDGQAGAIYGQYPPLVNVARKPGEWQTYDIMFEAPKFNGSMLVAPAYITLIWNGVLVQHRRPVIGATVPTMTPQTYTAHDAELPFTLQDHGQPVRFRNIWVRKLAGYDLPEN